MQTETQKKWNEHFNNDKINKRTPYPIIVLVISLLIIASIYMLKNNIVQDYYDHIRNGISDSSINGINMNKMINDVEVIMKKNSEFIDEFITNYDNDYTDIDQLQKWNTYLNVSEKQINGIHYHKSYTTYIESACDIIKSTQQLVTFSIEGKTDNDFLFKTIESINKKNHKITEDLIKAFDNNNIPYTKQDDGSVLYSYKVE